MEVKKIIGLYKLGYDEVETEILIESASNRCDLIINYHLKRCELSEKASAELAKEVREETNKGATLTFVKHDNQSKLY